MIKSWDDDAWSDYLYWQTQDKKTLKRINDLLKDIDRNGYTGTGKPEPLIGNLKGYWSRRIDDCNRIVYRIKNNRIEIIYNAVHIIEINKDTILYLQEITEGKIRPEKLEAAKKRVTELLDQSVMVVEKETRKLRPLVKYAKILT